MIIAAALLALGVAAPRVAQAETPMLNLFIWSDYITESIIDGFELQCGCKVVGSITRAMRRWPPS